MNERILKHEGLADCFYLYDEAVIKDNIARLKGSFAGIEFLYSVKCNPNRSVLKTVFDSGLGADAASLNEVLFAREAGLGRDMIFYSCPGKPEEELKKGLKLSTVIADSLSEVGRISKIAGENTAEIGLRINPDFTFDSDSGAAVKFGVDEGDALRFMAAEVPSNIRITGIHVHVKSQELNLETLTGYYRRLTALAQRVEAVLGYSLDYLNMGSGIGVAYSDTDTELDISALGKAAEGILAEFRSTHPHTRIMIETGRYAVCKSGCYVTHVVDKKVSHGKTFVILQNTLNGFFKPSLAAMVEKYAGGEASPTEPLYTGHGAFRIMAPYAGRETERVTLVGNLCCAADVIAEDVIMPVLNVGDAVYMDNAGSYAYVLSPMQFSSQTAPGEFMLYADGHVSE